MWVETKGQTLCIGLDQAIAISISREAFASLERETAFINFVRSKISKFLESEVQSADS